MVSATVRLAGVNAAADGIAAHVRSYLPGVLEKVGEETVSHLQSLTTEMRPPARGSIHGTGARPAHPGHWADITGDLAAAYEARVTATPDGADLRLSNDMPYAEHLERRDGFFVLTGVTDPGGFVDQKLAATWRAVKRIIERPSGPASGIRRWWLGRAG